MQLNGVVTNVTNFGAFVDVGVHLDGLVHISQLVDRYIKHAGEVVKVGQQVEVRVLGVDQERRRISLSMREDRSKNEEKPEKRRRRDSTRNKEITRTTSTKVETSVNENTTPNRRKKGPRRKKAQTDGTKRPSVGKNLTVDHLLKLNRKL